MTFAQKGKTVAFVHKNEVALFRKCEEGTQHIAHSIATVEEDSLVLSLTVRGDVVFASVVNKIVLWSLTEQKCVKRLKGHTLLVPSLKVSSDGTKIVSGSWDKTVRVWDIRTGTCLFILEGHSKDVNSVDISSDGTKALSGSDDKTIRVWSLVSGLCEHTIQCEPFLQCAVSFSPNGLHILGQKEYGMSVWDTHSAQFVRSFECAHSHYINSISFSFDGKQVLTGSSDKTIALHWFDTGKTIRTFTGHSNLVTSAEFSPDGTKIVSGSHDKTVKVWDSQTGECLFTFTEHSHIVETVHFSSDGTSLFSGSRDKTIKVWTIAKGLQINSFPLKPNSKTLCKLEFSTDHQTLIVHFTDNTTEHFSITDLIPELPTESSHKKAFLSAMARGCVISHSIKLLFLGATEAGKTALLAALQDDTLPGKDDRSVATRMHRMRIVFDGETGYFKAVPQEEFHLASLIGERMVAMETVEEEEDIAEEKHDDVDSTDEAGPSTEVEKTVSNLSPPTPSVAPSPPPPTPTPTIAATSDTLEIVQSVLETELREEHVDMDSFDFAGESMFDSLPALFMGNESVYVVVFDLSAMASGLLAAQRQYDTVLKWAHLIAHQVPTTQSSHFRVLIVGTHIDTFTDDTVPCDLLQLVAREMRRLVVPVLGPHLIRPPSTPSVPFFQVGSAKGLGLAAVSTALHSAVRPRPVPLEYVCAQDLIGRWARMGNVQLMCPVRELPLLELNDAPRITLGDLMPDTTALHDGVIPYLENSADILVSRVDRATLADSDMVVFDVPRLIAALELLCSVVMARWGRAKSKRARGMLAQVEKAGCAKDLNRTVRLLTALDATRQRPEAGFPFDVAQWLVWEAAAPLAKTQPLLAGADVVDPAAFLRTLEHLSLVFRHDDRLLVPMLLPDNAPFVEQAVDRPAQLFLYQMVGGAVLPVSLATFHLLVVALWRESVGNAAIQATQRCTNVLLMKGNGMVPVRLRLNTGEAFVRVELYADTPAENVRDTVDALIERVCPSTVSLRWGWRGGRAVVVPAHPFDTTRPLFEAEHVVGAPEEHREVGRVNLELMGHAGERQCNERLELWWCNQAVTGKVAVYSHAAALIVGVSRYKSSSNPNLAECDDLPGVFKSVVELKTLWEDRNFTVETVTDSPTSKVTMEAIARGANVLAGKAGESKTSLLVVHLIGHGAEDSGGGLILSDAKVITNKLLSRFGLHCLAGVLREQVHWRGCNILVVCDFCNAGALVSENGDLSMKASVAPLHGYARQMIASSINDASAYALPEGTHMTKALVEALGGQTPSAFQAGETVISAVELCRRLKSGGQGMLVGRIWNEWDRTRNEGDIFLFRDGSGV